MIVVTGATGNIGSNLVRILAESGARVTAISRGSKDFRLPDGVRHHTADLAEPQTLAPALDGAEALFVLISGDQLIDGPAPERLLDLARAGGVRRVVFVSSLGVVTRPDADGYARLAAFEKALRASDFTWTILRPGGFYTNTYAWAESVRTARTVAAPFGDIGLPSVDPADIAAVAAAALRTDDHAGQTYTLTGPAVVTPREQSADLGAALGDSVRFVELTRDQAQAGMRQFMPAAVVEHTLSILGEPTPEELAVSIDIERILGRPATGYAEWARRNRAAFA
ncbi:SDR family oxidoreductase [Nocardia arthritidis]|uniref:NAD(P)H-binding protein n=1 Tax=Nocardia arthritidis TaxID=228602 RepID=A0A6G9YJT6_9NOCA|nr:NAD(P)H-binding protein [Nocardia arthritidis]QIS13420.1 NAD(P)H-binding protein [Nocardia arthritidis]